MSLRGDHPTLARLEAQDPDPSVLEHLRACPRCRIDRRMLLFTPELPSDEAPPPGTWTSRERPDLLSTWLNSRAGQSPTRRATPALPDPRSLGPYVIDAVLGQGGMAVVYRVSRIGRPDERRALKVLSRPDPELRSRLRREGRVQRELDHDHVVRVLDQVDVAGEPALVMEYVAGPSLYLTLREELLPLELRDAIARDVLRGMAAAHAAGVVHRDLKPSNVLLEPAGDGFTAKVADFGIARADRHDDSVQSRSGAFAGTPLYMAPEQLRDASRADLRSDVFSLGALLYELATGVRCFAGLDYVDIVGRVAEVRYRPPTDVVPDLPGRMVQAIRASLQVDPSDRPADAREVLALWEAGTPSMRPSWPEPLRRQVLALHDPERTPPSDPSATPWPPRHTLPEPRTIPAERQSLRLELLDALSRERVVTLVGPPGVGKARLAVEAARDALHTFPGGVWWCDLGSISKLEAQIREIASQLAVPLYRPAIAQLGDAIRGRGRALIVLLDPSDELVECALESWLDRAPEAVFLVSAESGLDLLEEVVLSVVPLASDEPPARPSPRPDGFEDLLRALEGSLAQAEASTALELYRAATARRPRRLLVAEREALLGRVADAGDSSPEQRARIELERARLDLERGNASRALERCEALLPTLEAKDGALRLHTLARGRVRAARGDARRAREDLSAVLSALQREHDAAGVAEVRVDLGELEVEAGAFAEAVEHLLLAIEGLARVGERRQEAAAWIALSGARHALGQLDVSEEDAARGLRIAREIGARTEVVRAERRLAELALELEDCSRASEHLERAVREARAGDDAQTLAVTLSQLAAVRARAGSDRRAAELIGEAARVAPASRGRAGVRLRLYEAEVALHQADHSGAREALAAADHELAKLHVGSGSAVLRHRDRVETALRACHSPGSPHKA